MRFKNGKPQIQNLIALLLKTFQDTGIAYESIILVGGWAKTARENGYHDQCRNSVKQLQILINQSSKLNGDVDFVIFQKTVMDTEKIKSVLFQLNNGLPANSKDFRIGLVFVNPTKIRYPGILIQ